MDSEVALILAVASNGVIGNDNKLVWRLKTDMKHFKDLTSNQVVLMGRKTYESLGKPLPNRINIVLSRNPNLHFEGCILVNSLEEGISAASKHNKSIFIIGGADIYKQSLPLVDKVYLTRVLATPEGDAYFDLNALTSFKKGNSVFHSKDENNEYNFIIEEYSKP